MAADEHSAFRDLALLFGLEGLRLGKHILRDERRIRVGECWVKSLWQAQIRPSFHAAAVVSVVATGDWAFRGEKSAGRLRAAFAVEGETAVADISADPVPSAAKQLDIFAETGGEALDGIEYSLRCETASLTTTLEFSNPRLPQWTALEKALLAVASEVVSRANNQGLRSYLNVWQSYLSRAEGAGGPLQAGAER